MKRFIDTSIWTQNKWFRKLDPKYKLLWIYLFCNCDNVGVWEEDCEQASWVIGHNYTKEEIDEVFKDRIIWFSEKKLWIIDFCVFQYGELIEDNIKNKPHQSYISLLKKHNLWIDYTKTIDSLSYRLKDKDKEKDKDKDKEEDKEKDFIKTWRNDFPTYIEGLKAACRALMADIEWLKAQEKYHPGVDIKLSVEKAVMNFWATEAGWKHKKGKKSKDLDWKATLTNAINLNKVYKPKNAEEENKVYKGSFFKGGKRTCKTESIADLTPKLEQQ